jgi:hypothetical protein
MASLHDRFQQAIDARAAARQPGTVGGAMDRYGWSTREVAQQFGVSERTARRWRQQDRIPERRRADWREATTRAARGRQRARMERGGLRGMSAAGTYKVSKSTYRTGPASRIRTLGESDARKITAGQMRDYWAAVDSGNDAEADRILNEALAGDYAPDARGLAMEDADDVDFTI